VRRLFVIAFVAIATLIVVGLFLWPRDDGHFDGAAWRAVGRNTSCANTQRQGMVGDLAVHVLRRGMAASRVVSLLGAPRRVSHGSRGDVLEWVIGHGESDCFYFDVKLEHGRVAKIGNPTF